MRYILASLAALVAFALLPASAMADARYGKQKVVYHINENGGDGDKAYMAALGNIQNHINAVGKDNIEVKIVLHGDGVNLLKSAGSNEKLQSRLVGLKAQGVQQAICNNTLTGRKIDYEKDLFEVFKEDIVPSGVAELSYLQQKGYTYIKP
jgi:intracellular sulfur oxidation DsrE/DsrF family protein